MQSTSVINYIRRPQVWGTLLSVVVMAIIALAFFYPDNFDGRTLSQPDMQQGAANGHEGLVFQQETGEKALWTNSLFGGMPTFQISPSYASNSLFSWINGAYGLWLPAPSNLLFMMMMGFFILMLCMGKKWYYALIGAIAWGFSSYFIIIIGAGHIWKFVTLAYVPPTIAGVIMLYRGRYAVGTALTALFAMMQLNANHPQMSYYFGIVMVLIALAYLVQSCRERKLRRWCMASVLAVAAGALAVGANAPSLYNTYKYSKETQRAVSELAQGDAAASSSGMSNDQILGWSYGIEESFSLMVPNVKGGASARPEAGQMQYHTLDKLPEAAQYATVSGTGDLLRYLPQYFNDSEGTNGPVYVGVIVFALFLMGCFIVRGPLKWAMIAATLMSVVLAWGYNAQSLSDWMIANFPMYNKFRAVESILVVAEFAIPFLGILALSQFIEAGKNALSRYKLGFGVGFGFPLAVALVATLFPSAFGPFITSSDLGNPNLRYVQSYLAQMATAQGASPMEIDALLYDYSLSNPRTQQVVSELRSGLVQADGLRSLLFLALAGGTLVLCGCGRCRRGVAVGALGVFVLVDLYGVDKRYVSHSSFTEGVDPESQGIVADQLDLAIMQDGAGHYRVLDIPGFSSARRSYFHHMIGGYHSAKLRRTNDIVAGKLIPAYSTYGYDSVPSQQELTADMISDLLNARYIITGDPSRPVIRNNAAMGNAWFVDSIIYVPGAQQEYDALEAGFADFRTTAVADTAFESLLGQANPVGPGDFVTLTDYTPNKLEYNYVSTLGGVVVFSEVYFPWGWKAVIDGQETPLGRVDYLLRALRVPAGEHSIIMTFAPESVSRSEGVAYACVTLIYMLLIFGAFVQLRRWQVF